MPAGDSVHRLARRLDTALAGHRVLAPGVRARGGRAPAAGSAPAGGRARA